MSAKLPAGCRIVKLADGEMLARMVQKELKKAGVRAKILNIEEGTGSAEAVKMILEASGKIRKPAILLGSGEFPVAVSGKGKGGRCSHLAALVEEVFGKEKKWFFGAIATDGEDGSAGGGAFIFDEAGIPRGELHAAIRDFDTGSLLQKKGLLLPREPSRNNLRDLWFLSLEE